MNITFNYIEVNSSITNEKRISDISNSYFKLFSSLNGTKIRKTELESDSPLFYFVLTGGTESIVLDLVEQRSKFIRNEPVYIISHSSENSLPASLEILAKLIQDGKNGKVFYLESPKDEAGINKIKTTIKFIKVKEELENTKIGLIGDASDWLVASSPNIEKITERWGPQIINIDLAEVTENLVKNIPSEKILTDLKSGAENIIEPTTSEISDNEHVYYSIKNLVHKYELDSLSVRCFDLVLNQKTTGCFALSQLNDDGIIAGCEGDLVSTTGMLIAYKLTGQLIWMANPSKINLQDSTLTLAHCTVPRKMISSYTLRSHFESGIGIGIEGNLPEGNVTLFRIGGKNINKLWAAEGKLVNSNAEENLCRTQAKIKINDKSLLEELLSNPLGNHLLMVYGNHSDLLNDYKFFTENKIEE